ncbi:hypothetical protein CPB85DRAFT_592745 [Mucidula mucida]|nr:hypothetical protein CPB85DRAFT_592745 [Mucidula mucida]
MCPQCRLFETCAPPLSRTRNIRCTWPLETAVLVVWTLYEPDTISIASPKIRPELVGNCRACGYLLRMPPRFAAGSDYACASSSTARRFRISQSGIQSLQSRTTRVVCNGLLLRSLHSMTAKISGSGERCRLFTYTFRNCSVENPLTMGAS